MAVELAEHRFLVRCGDGAKARSSGTCVFYLHGYNNTIQVFKRRVTFDHDTYDIFMVVTGITSHCSKVVVHSR